MLRTSFFIYIHIKMLGASPYDVAKARTEGLALLLHRALLCVHLNEGVGSLIPHFSSEDGSSVHRSSKLGHGYGADKIIITDYGRGIQTGG